MSKFQPFLLLVALSATTVTALAQDKVTIKPDNKVGDLPTMKVVGNFSVASTDVELKFSFKRKLTKVDETKLLFEGEFTDLSVVVGGNSQDSVPYTPPKWTLAPTGSLLKFEGGLEGADSMRMGTMGLFIPPTKEIAAGEKYTVEFDAVKEADIPKRKYEGTYVGKESLNGKDLHKFTLKYSEPGDPTNLSFEGTFWVTETGAVIKAETKFKDLFIPVAGQTAEGTLKFEAVAG